MTNYFKFVTVYMNTGFDPLDLKYQTLNLGVYKIITDLPFYIDIYKRGKIIYWLKNPVDPNTEILKALKNDFEKK